VRYVAREAKAPEVHPWSAGQLAAFLRWAEDQSRDVALWTVLAMTGMRRGEALSLRWRDIDLDAVGSVFLFLALTSSSVAVITAPLPPGPHSPARSGRKHRCGDSPPDPHAHADAGGPGILVKRSGRSAAMS
jgi:hypothetical protein